MFAPRVVDTTPGDTLSLRDARNRFVAAHAVTAPGLRHHVSVADLSRRRAVRYCIGSTRICVCYAAMRCSGYARHVISPHLTRLNRILPVAFFFFCVAAPRALRIVRCASRVIARRSAIARWIIKHGRRIDLRYLPAAQRVFAIIGSFSAPFRRRSLIALMNAVARWFVAILLTFYALPRAAPPYI